MSSLTKVSVFTSKIAITCLSSLLIACEPLLFGGVAGFAGSSSSGVTQCESGPADLSGVCRNNIPTIGALEAVEQTTTVAALNVNSAVLPAHTGSLLNIAWSPYPGIAAGYLVYFGSTVNTATTLASDLQIGMSNIDPSAPSISYEAMQDLGLSTGSTVCFRILAYDPAHVPYDWSEEQCSVV